MDPITTPLLQQNCEISVEGELDSVNLCRPSTQNQAIVPPQVKITFENKTETIEPLLFQPYHQSEDSVNNCQGEDNGRKKQKVFHSSNSQNQPLQHIIPNGATVHNSLNQAFDILQSSHNLEKFLSADSLSISSTTLSLLEDDTEIW